jgi:NB-ARC domain
VKLQRWRSLLHWSPMWLHHAQTEYKFTHELQEAITRHLRSHRILLIVDDVWGSEHDIIDETGFLGDLATGQRSNSSWLLTSRQRL